MNNAHSTYYTDTPEDGITYVLRGLAKRGWPDRGAPRRVAGRPSSRRTCRPMRATGGGAERINGNSIFTLHHLRPHHRPSRTTCITALTKDHLNNLDRIDVLMVPIDGAYTVGLPVMVEVHPSGQPRIVLPMGIGDAVRSRLRGADGRPGRCLHLARPSHHRGRRRHRRPRSSPSMSSAEMAATDPADLRNWPARWNLEAAGEPLMTPRCGPVARCSARHAGDAESRPRNRGAARRFG